MDIAVMGSAFVELVPARFRVALEDIDSFRISIGGSATNMAVAASRLGASVGLLSAVGQDVFGEFVIHHLRSEGIDVSRVKRVAGFKTGVSFYTVDPKGTKQYHFYRFQGYANPESTLRGADVDKSYVRKAKALAFGEACVRQLPSRRYAISVARLARERRQLVLYDPNYRSSLWKSRRQASKVTEQMMRLATIVTPNRQEALQITGNKNIDSAVEELLRLGPKVVAVKDGERGCIIATKTEVRRIPAFKVQLVDDTGAGDAFASGLLVGILGGLSLPNSAVLANAAAALKATRVGTRDAMPTMKEVKRFLSERRTKLEGLR